MTTFTRKHMVWRSATAFALAIGCIQNTAAADWYDWVDKPWPARYVISVALDYSSSERIAIKLNDKQRKLGRTEQWHFAEFFDANYILRSSPHPSGWIYEDVSNHYDNFGFQVIEFDQSGKVLTPNRVPQPLQIKYSANSYLRFDVMMVEGNATKGNPFYRLGEWYTYLPGAQGDNLTPALCNFDDDGRYSINSSDRYFHPDMKFNLKDVLLDRGTFGCREWAYQMKRPVSVAGLGGQVPDANGQCQDGSAPGQYKGKLVCPGLDESSRFKPNARGFVQPYIDITTYHDKLGKKTHIGRFIGWMGFKDAPRPIIGKHGDYWVCLHECPDGEKPGLIGDIAEWTGKRGWPLPKPGAYFPDAKVKVRNVEAME